MLRFFLLLGILTLSLYALSDAQILDRAGKMMKYGTKSEKFRAYNDYRNLYLRAMMNDDNNLKVDSLRGIVKSGSELHIDVEDYKDELHRVTRTSRYKKSARDTHLSQPTLHTRSLKLKDATWSKNKLILIFNNEINEEQIRYFTMRSKTNKHYKYIFDFKSARKSKSYNLKKKGLSRVIIAQYKANVLRLVIEDDEKLDIKFKSGNKKLIIFVDKSIQKTYKKTSKVNSKKHLKKNKSKVQDAAISKYMKNLAPIGTDKVIVIDAGHGGKDPGATGYRHYREKNVVLGIAQKLRKILKSRGYKVYLTRSRDHFVKLSHRTQFANKRNADIFVSIHANAVPKKYAKKTHGIECYFLAKSKSERAKSVAATENMADISEMNFYGKESFLNTLNSHNIVASNKLAIDLQRGMLGTLEKSYKDIKDAGVREGPFWVLVGAQMPSVLVEVGFITHPQEARRLVSSRYQEKLALGLANGIERYFLNN